MNGIHEAEGSIPFSSTGSIPEIQPSQIPTTLK